MKRYVLLVFVLVCFGLIPAAQPVAAAPMAAPPSGWVQAQVVGGGCDAQGHCSSTVKPGSPTLYEYKPDRQSVGRDFAVTRERIRQIEAKALRKLKHPSRSRKMRSFLDQ